MSTLTNTNYNGNVADMVYKDLAEGNQVIAKGCAYLDAGIRTKKPLPLLDQDSQPLGTYVATPVGGNTTSVTDWSERTLTVSDMMMYERFNSNTFTALWDKWASLGQFSDIRLNHEFLRDVLEVASPNIGAHLSQLFFAGDTAGAAGLDLMDGIIKTATADANTVKVTPNGVITTANVMAVLQAVVDAIPDKDYDNEDYKILMPTSAYRIAQRQNTILKQANDGVLNDTFKNLIEEKKLVHFAGMTDNTIIATKASNNPDSNLYFGFWFDEQNEKSALRVDRVANDSDEYFIKLNIKAGANYRKSENVILYLPA